MAKRAFCKHTKMISGVANYFSETCTLLGTPSPHHQLHSHSALRHPPPQTRPLRGPLYFCSYSLYRCLCGEMFKWFAHLQPTPPSATTNMANITKPRFYFHHQQHNNSSNKNNKQEAKQHQQQQQPQATNEILKFYFHPSLD